MKFFLKPAQTAFSLIFGLVTLAQCSTNSTLASEVVAVWGASLPERPLKTWSSGDPEAVKVLNPRNSYEKDPITGKRVKWYGTLFSKWIDQTVGALPLAEKAQVDLVILHGEGSVSSSFIPRSVITKYPLFLAWSADGKDLASGWQSLVPESLKSKLKKEKLTYESYSLANVKKIELTSYQKHFETYFLKTRTDPASVKGEKLFIHNCASCHKPQFQKFSPEAPHEAREKMKLKGVPELNAKEMKAIQNYINAFQRQAIDRPISSLYSGVSDPKK